MAELPRVVYTGIAETSLANVHLTTPSSIVFPPGESSFPTALDAFKGLTYEAPQQEEMKVKLSEYHSLMVKIMGGTSTNADVDRLKVLLVEIREFVLTEDDLNLMVDSLNKIEKYIFTYLKNDLNAKARELDVVINGFVLTLREFMDDLEAKYNNSPSNYPIPDESILFSKTEKKIQNVVTYNEATMGVIAGTVQPTRPVNRSIIWIDTNMSDAD